MEEVMATSRIQTMNSNISSAEMIKPREDVKTVLLDRYFSYLAVCAYQ